MDDHQGFIEKTIANHRWSPW